MTDHNRTREALERANSLRDAGAPAWEVIDAMLLCLGEMLPTPAPEAQGGRYPNAEPRCVHCGEAEAVHTPLCPRSTLSGGGESRWTPQVHDEPQARGVVWDARADGDGWITDVVLFRLDVRRSGRWELRINGDVLAKSATGGREAAEAAALKLTGQMAEAQGHMLVPIGAAKKVGG